ncbi:uncharacterized protein [Rutidosis leptorrhynchoides]|uniref:uncharacterized protein n=1 Tax=Rutidosis leptorrhynchoides TaxID=125765 RepID=UPI003A99B20A
MAYIDDVIFPSSDIGTRWHKLLPRKFNVFIWRVARNRLPTRLNFSVRDMEIVDIGCVVCDYNVEPLDHVLFGCSVATVLWRKLKRWVDLDDLQDYASWSEWINWFDTWQASSTLKSKLYVIMASFHWHNWRYHNNILFGSPASWTSDSLPSSSNITDNIMVVVIPILNNSQA